MRPTSLPTRPATQPATRPGLRPLCRRLPPLVLPLVLIAGLVPGPAARAAGAAAVQLAQAEGAGFSQAQLESYVAAVLKVRDVHSSWQPKITEAASDAEARTLTAQATAEMVHEVEAQGLSVQEYNSITQAAEQDDQLRQRIIALLEQSRTK